MNQSSRSVTSGQAGPHIRLLEVVRRHRDVPFRRPLATHTSEAFDAVAEVIGDVDRPLVLDAGCGTGDSTQTLARMWPQAWVIGVDRSAKRLENRFEGDATVARAGDNAIFVRANLEDWFVLAAAARWRFHHCYFLYPNPYPKSGHLKRRWHAHPIFPTIVQVSREITLRTNWRIYAEEFSVALGLFDCRSAVREVAEPIGLSPFERKYSRSGHLLYEVTANLD